MAVHREDDVAEARDEVVEPAQELGVLLRHGVPDGVGDVDRRRALVEGDLDHLGRELDVGARGVHGRELDVVGVALGLGHRGAGEALDVLARRLQLVDDVDVRGRDERVDARPRGLAHRLPRALDVGGVGAGQPRDHRAVDLSRDRPHGLEVARRGDREAGLDDVDPEPRELVGDLELLGRVEADARRLLPVAQGGVEDEDPVGVRRRGHARAAPVWFVVRFRPRSRLQAAATRRSLPLVGEEEKSEGEQGGRHVRPRGYQRRARTTSTGRPVVGVAAGERRGRGHQAAAGVPGVSTAGASAGAEAPASKSRRARRRCRRTLPTMSASTTSSIAVARTLTSGGTPWRAAP